MIVDSNYQKIRPRRGAKEDWIAKNPILSDGEIAIEYPEEGITSDGTKIRLKIGDGETSWNDLPYVLDSSLATSIIAGDISSDNLISIKTATNAEWLDADPVLRLGEVVYDRTKGEMKVGDGIHRFSELRYIGQTWESNMMFDFGNYDYPENI